MVICLLLVFALISCDIAINIHTDSDDNGSTTIPDKDANSDSDKSSSNENNSDSNKTDGNEDNNSVALEQIDNGVLKEVSSETMSVPENMKFLGTVNATEENNATNVVATVVLYSLDGDVVNWKTENDLNLCHNQRQ
ncbi:MAG: hypothetical protein IJ009_02035 [Clostridia bacterium]|nr:hypothetical protein [Clostridia bacterium]